MSYSFFAMMFVSSSALPSLETHVERQPSINKCDPRAELEDSLVQDVQVICVQLVSIARNPPRCKEFLAARDDKAQSLLNLLQAVRLYSFPELLTLRHYDYSFWITQRRSLIQDHCCSVCCTTWLESRLAVQSPFF